MDRRKEEMTRRTDGQTDGQTEGQITDRQIDRQPLSREKEEETGRK